MATKKRKVSAKKNKLALFSVAQLQKEIAARREKEVKRLTQDRAEFVKAIGEIDRLIAKLTGQSPVVRVQTGKAKGASKIVKAGKTGKAERGGPRAMDDVRDAILKALASENEGMGISDIIAATGVQRWRVRLALRQLSTGKQLKKTGRRRSMKYFLQS